VQVEVSECEIDDKPMRVLDDAAVTDLGKPEDAFHDVEGMMTRARTRALER